MLLNAQAGRAADTEIIAVPEHGKDETQACGILLDSVEVRTRKHFHGYGCNEHSD